MVSAARLEEVLADTFHGQAKLAHALVPSCMQALTDFRPWHQTYAELEKTLENVLFNSLYTALGDSMTFSADHRHYRIHMDDLPELADRVLLVLFEDLTVCATNCQKLHDYAMDTGSASAMQVLIRAYQAFLPEGETGVMEHVLSGRSSPL